MSLEKKVMKWLATCNTGSSSQTMAYCAMGMLDDLEYWDYPLDPSDFNRCLILVNEIPEIKDSFDKISKISKEWGAIIDNWDKIEEWFVSEVGYDWCKGNRAPMTYNLMKEVLNGVNQ